MSPPPLIDTHCHLNFHSYEDDRAAVLQRANEAGVSRIIVPAIDRDSCHQVLHLAESYEGTYAAVGIHPNSSLEFDESVTETMREMTNRLAVVAIGEIGLDYHWDKSPKRTQHGALERQLELAAQTKLPVIIHNRDAGPDLMAILDSWAPTVPASLAGRLGVLHSFSATYEIAQRALDLGFYIGFTGPITFKKADALRDIARRIPLNRLLIETDGPFLAPQKRRGKRNEPAYLAYINEKLAELHAVSADEMAWRTTANAERLFALA